MIKSPDDRRWGKAPQTAAKRDGTALWFAVGAFVFASLLGADLIWELFAELVQLVYEFVAERFERFFQKTFGLDLYHAQMATAYTGSLILLALAVGLLRKASGLTRQIHEEGMRWWHSSSDRTATVLREFTIVAVRWWNSLDAINKSAVVIALAVLVIPVALLLSYGLGMAVAQML